MPAKSKAQLRFMAGIASGSITPPKGLSRKEAAEFVHATPKGAKLPARAKAKGKKG